MAETRYAWDHATYCGLFVEQAERIAGIAAGADPATAVPSCPGWTLAKLLKHLGTAHAWAAANTRAGAPDTPVVPRTLDLGLPEDPADYPDWLLAGAKRTAQALWDAGPDAAAWTFGPVPHARFWGRRMFHETLMHRVDAELALGLDPEVSQAAAVDCIDELLTVLPGSGAPPESRPRGQGETLHIHASGEVSGEWTITLTPDGYTWDRTHGKGDAALRGTGPAVLEVLYRRRELPDALDAGVVELFGDRKVLQSWLAGSAL